jgi:NADPH:quinone reductase
LEEVADQPVGAFWRVGGRGGDDSGVGHQDQWDVLGHEVRTQPPSGLGFLDQLRDTVIDVVSLRPEFAGSRESLGQDVAEPAVAPLHAGDGGEVVAKAAPRIRVLQRAVDRFGIRGELRSESGDQQVLPGREAAEQSGDANASPAGDLLGGNVQPLLGENLPGGLQERLPVAFGVSAQVLTTAVAGVVRLHLTDPSVKWNGRSKSCTLELDRPVQLCVTGCPSRSTTKPIDHTITMEKEYVMRAVVLTSAESTSPELVDLPLPEPKAGEVRVKVAAASVNGFDLSVAAGHTKAYMEHRYPLVLGKDFAGTIDAVGPDTSGYAVGDRVFGTVTKEFLGDGSFAEYVAVPVQVGIAHLPETVSFVDGAALGLAGTAAYTAVDAANIDADTSVLVIGATGGVGVQVVQLTAAAGATVAGTSGTEAEAQLLRSLGATAVIDRTGDVVEQAREVFPDGADVIIHLAGEPKVAAAREGGTLVSTILFDPAQVPSNTVKLAPVMANPTPQLLTRIADAHVAGHSGTVIQQTHRLEEVSDAFAAFAGGTVGKIVLVIDQA